MEPDVLVDVLPDELLLDELLLDELLVDAVLVDEDEDEEPALEPDRESVR